MTQKIQTIEHLRVQVKDLVDALAESRLVAIEGEKIDAEGSLAVVVDPKFKVQTQSQYVEIGEVVRAAKAKLKFLDDERKVSVKPLNDEVDRINDWYRPATTALKRIVDRCESLLGQYVLQQKREEERLLKEAQEAARAVRATQPDAPAAVAAVTAPMVSAAAATTPPKVAGLSHRPTWEYVVKDPDKLVRARPDLAMPDPKKVRAWVEEHGDRDVPPGVEVTESVAFRSSKVK